MSKIFIFIAFLCFSGLVCACGTDAQRGNMAAKLYMDADMRKFVCASDSCSIEDFKGGLRFTEYRELFHENALSVCLIEPVLIAANSYTGVFMGKNGKYEFQFISYGSGVKVAVNEAGVPMVIEYSFSDPENPDYSLDQYLWNGQAFIFSRTVPLNN